MVYERLLTGSGANHSIAVVPSRVASPDAVSYTHLTLPTNSRV